MTELTIHAWATCAEFALAAIAFVALLVVSAPYGRYARPGWGPTLPAVLGWLAMELPAVVLFGVFFFTGRNRVAPAALVLLGLWQFHYLYRTFVFPLRMRDADRRIPVLIPLLAIAFNTLNAYVNGRWIGQFGTYAVGWLTDARFIVGAIVFLGGWVGHVHSDAVLRSLRRRGESGYVLPRGGLFRWVSAPNYLGEIVEWVGWAIATWSTAGLAFAVFTLANLIPRALRHHVWYQARFPEYPTNRKALIPFVL